MAIRERFYLYQQYVDYLYRNAIIAVTVCVAAAAVWYHDKTTDARKAIASKTRCKPPGIISDNCSIFCNTSDDKQNKTKKNSYKTAPKRRETEVKQNK